jgi:DHA1 family bicyclomycin/chloramphenicol resistance-like MFS transporter
MQHASGAGHRAPSAFVIGLLAALSALGALTIDMYLPALPAIARALHAEPGAIQWSLSVFFAGFALGQLIWGPVSDRLGRRAPLAAGLALYVVGSVLCAISVSASQLIGARFVEALGASAGPVLARAIVADLTDREGAARLLSTLLLVMGVAPLAAPAIGAQLLALSGWRAIFVLLAVIGAIVLVACRWLAETRPAELRPQTPLGASLVAAGARYRSLATDPGFMGFAFTAASVYGGMFAFITASPFVFISGYGLSPVAYTMLFGANIVGIMSGAAINRKLLPRFGSARLLAAGVTLNLAAAVLLLCVALLVRGAPHLWYLLLVPTLAYYLSINFVAPNGFAAALAASHGAGGTGSALAGCLQFGLAAVVGSLVALFDNRSPVPMAVAMLGCSAIAALALLAARRTRDEAPSAAVRAG